jgi:hypothetical protein
MRHHPSTLKPKHTVLALALVLALLSLALALPVSAAQSGMGHAGRIEPRSAQDGIGMSDDRIDRGRDILDDMPLPDTQNGDTSDDHDGNIANDPNGIANNGMADGGADHDSAHDLSREPMDSAGILPWIIGALVVLAIVLVVLALLPKKRYPR